MKLVQCIRGHRKQNRQEKKEQDSVGAGSFLDSTPQLADASLTFEGSLMPSPISVAFSFQGKTWKCLPWKWLPGTHILKNGLGIMFLKSQLQGSRGSRQILGLTSQSAYLLGELKTSERPYLKRQIVSEGQYPRWSSGLHSKECAGIYTQRWQRWRDRDEDRDREIETARWRDRDGERRRQRRT